MLKMMLLLLLATAISSVLSAMQTNITLSSDCQNAIAKVNSWNDIVNFENWQVDRVKAVTDVQEAERNLCSPASPASHATCYAKTIQPSKSSLALTESAENPYRRNCGAKRSPVITHIHKRTLMGSFRTEIARRAFGTGTPRTAMRCVHVRTRTRTLR